MANYNGLDDIVGCARLETADALASSGYHSNFDENGNLTEQFAALKNKDGVMLKPLSGSDSLVAETSSILAQQKIYSY